MTGATPVSTRMSSEGDAVLSRLVGREAGLIVAALHRRTGNFDIAEEAVQEALVAALQTWRRDGVPPNPAAWLTLTAQRRAIDLLRKLSRERRVVGEAELEIDAADTMASTTPAAKVADERLPMLFGCFHPALHVDIRIALTMRAVMGMTTAQIAHAFLLPEPTMAQRLVRAKHKVTTARIPFVVPEEDDLAPRLNDVLTVVYLCYNEGYLQPNQELPGLVDDAIWLAELVAGQLSREPEAWGLLALLTFLASRAGARFDDNDALIPASPIRIGDAGIRSRSRAPTGTSPAQPRSTGRALSSSKPRSPPAMRRRRVGSRRTGSRSSRSTISCSAWTVLPSYGSIARSRWAGSTVPRWHWPRWTRSVRSSTPITCCMPPVRTC